MWRDYVENPLAIAMENATCARACDETNSRSAEELFATMMRDPSSDLLCEARFPKSYLSNFSLFAAVCASGTK